MADPVAPYSDMRALTSRLDVIGAQIRDLQAASGTQLSGTVAKLLDISQSWQVQTGQFSANAADWVSGLPAVSGECRSGHIKVTVMAASVPIDMNAHSTPTACMTVTIPGVVERGQQNLSFDANGIGWFGSDGATVWPGGGSAAMSQIFSVTPYQPFTVQLECRAYLAQETSVTVKNARLMVEVIA